MNVRDHEKTPTAKQAHGRANSFAYFTDSTQSSRFRICILYTVARNAFSDFVHLVSDCFRFHLWYRWPLRIQDMKGST